MKVRNDTWNSSWRQTVIALFMHYIAFEGMKSKFQANVQIFKFDFFKNLIKITLLRTYTTSADDLGKPLNTFLFKHVWAHQVLVCKIQ